MEFLFSFTGTNREELGLNQDYTKDIKKLNLQFLQMDYRLRVRVRGKPMSKTYCNNMIKLSK